MLTYNLSNTQFKLISNLSFFNVAPQDIIWPMPGLFHSKELYLVCHFRPCPQRVLWRKKFSKQFSNRMWAVSFWSTTIVTGCATWSTINLQKNTFVNSVLGNLTSYPLYSGIFVSWVPSHCWSLPPAYINYDPAQ